MVVALTMEKPTLKISVSDTESTSSDGSEETGNEMGTEELNADADISLSENENDNNEVLMSNEGWADSVAKILGSSKPKNKKTLVLSRAKKHSEILKTKKEEKPPFEIIGEIKEEKIEDKIEEPQLEPESKKPKHEKSSIRVKPNILEKDRERLLAKIATKGVVQLFNAVRNQQKSLEKELKEDLTEAKKEKILKKFDKRAFLDTLMGQTKSIVVDEKTKGLKNEVKAESEQPKWNALRDDFMMGAKMKDWDKEAVDD